VSEVPAALGCAGCAARDEGIALLRGQADVLRAQLKDQQDKIARLERLVSRNSGNSSMPPSADDLPGKKQPQDRKRGASGKRRPGKQPGAPGAHLAWNNHPDKTIDHFPGGDCACGADLREADDLGVTASHQVTDIPGIQVKTTQHDRHTLWCLCGRLHTAAAPGGAGAPGTVTYGLNIQAWCVFLLVMHHVPVQRCADILESLTGTRPSDGYVHSLLARATRGVTAANRLIRALIVLARVVCADETPIRVGPGPKTRKRYLLVACTNLLTCYFLGDRSLATFNEFVVPDLSGTVVHDRYACYDSFTDVSHQLCAAHILRDLEDAAETCPDAIWPGQIASNLRALIHQANLARAQGLAAVPGDSIAEELKLFRHGVRAGLSQVPRIPGSNEKQPPGRLLLECLRGREHDVLRFLTDLGVPPTNNQAERDARPAKTQQKISGRLRSGQAARDRYAIRGYLSTAAKHGISIFTAILGALTGNPWMPPIPEHA
jgi:transposase